MCVCVCVCAYISIGNDIRLDHTVKPKYNTSGLKKLAVKTPEDRVTEKERLHVMQIKCQ